MQTILVCDDDKQIVEAIDIYLTGEGFKVIKAYDGYEALEYLDKNEVDLLIVDVMMPGLDGIRNEIMPPESVDTNIYKLTQKERERMGIDSLPGSLLEAAREFEKDTFIKDVLGKELAEKYIAAKKEEYRQYRAQITEWEIQKYLRVI